MTSARWPAVLHEGESQQQLEVSADPQTLILHLPGKVQRWSFTEVRYRSGGVPRFERGESLLIVADHEIVKSIERLNPEAVSTMEKTGGGMFTARDFLTGLVAVLIVMAGALALVGVIWLVRRK